MEKLISNRPKNILYHNDYIWKCSSKGRELEAASDELFDYAKKVKVYKNLWFEILFVYFLDNRYKKISI